MVHLLIIKLNFKEIDGVYVPVTGIPVGSRTVVMGLKCALYSTVLIGMLVLQYFISLFGHSIRHTLENKV